MTDSSFAASMVELVIAGLVREHSLMKVVYWKLIHLILKGMRKVLLCSVVLLIAGCGVTVTTSGVKAGIIDRVVKVENGSQVISEDFFGLQVQWCPDFTWSDVKRLFKKEEQPETVP